MACAALASQRLLRRLPVLGARALKAQALAVAVPLHLPTVARLVGAQACSTQYGMLFAPECVSKVQHNRSCTLCAGPVAS